MQCGKPLRLFHKYIQKIWDGYIRKSAQFWLIYIDTMGNQHQYQISVQNDFTLSLSSTESFILLYFHYSFFFYLGFLSQTCTIHKTVGEGGGCFFSYSLPTGSFKVGLRSHICGKETIIIFYLFIYLFKSF